MNIPTKFNFSGSNVEDLYFVVLLSVLFEIKFGGVQFTTSSGFIFMLIISSSNSHY